MILTICSVPLSFQSCQIRKRRWTIFFIFWLTEKSCCYTMIKGENKSCIINLSVFLYVPYLTSVWQMSREAATTHKCGQLKLYLSTPPFINTKVKNACIKFGSNWIKKIQVTKKIQEQWRVYKEMSKTMSNTSRRPIWIRKAGKDKRTQMEHITMDKERKQQETHN